MPKASSRGKSVEFVLPPSRAAYVERLLQRRAKLYGRLISLMMQELHPDASTLADAESETITTSVADEAAEALVNWKDALAEGPIRPSTPIQRLLELCRRLDQRVEDIKEAETAAEVQRLARLTPAAYDRCKRARADQLGIGLGTLNKLVSEARSDVSGELVRSIVVWPEAVDGPTLLTEIAAAVCRHVVMSVHEAAAIALWVLHCFAIDAFSISPRLLVRSATMRSGKTTLRDLLFHLVPKLSSDNLSVAMIYRAADRDQPTLLLDEVDSWIKRDPQIRGLINSGYRRGGFVMRIVNGQQTQFRTFAPMMLAGIGRMAATIEDRAIQIVLRRRRADETYEPFRGDQADHLDQLARRASRWASDHLHALSEAEPVVPASLDDRAADNWRPLLAIADRAGTEWGRLARAAAESLVQMTSDDALDERLIRDIATIFASKKGDRIPSEQLAASLAGLEGGPWAEFRGARPLSKHKLAGLLKPFSIQPATIRIGARTIKGYLRSQFDDAFARYAPTSPPDSSHRNSGVTQTPDPQGPEHDVTT
jgi:putative DNA primase/helicase